MRRSTSTARRACALGTTAALVVLTTGLGIMTATAANAAPSDTDGSVSVQADPTQTETPAPTDTPSPTVTPAPTTTPSPTSTPAPTGEPTPTGSTAPTFPLLPHLRSSAPAASDATDASTTAAAAAPTATITGDAKVGSTLTASWDGFDADGSFKYQWLDATGAPIYKAQSQTWKVDAAYAGTKVSVEVTGDVSGAVTGPVESEQSAEITQDPVFVDETGTPLDSGTEADEDTYSLPQDATAGEAFSYTFRAEGYPAPTYQLAWYYDDEEDSIDNVESNQAEAQADSTLGFGWEEDGDVNGDGEYTPEDQLPKGITFDPTTGELSGTATEASTFDFAVTATSGDVTTTVYAELTVDPGAAYGLAAQALDAGLVHGDEGSVYFIRPDGSVVGVTIDPDGDGFFADDSDLLDHVSVKQGGTLLVYGTPVDRFGNDIEQVDEDGELTVKATVTSNVASDVIKPYTEDGADDFGVTSVTFPHASTHTLTVSAEALQPVSFDVEVTPTVAPAVAVTPTATGTRGQLAYTGSDATGALPWALGLVLAGAGLLGARTLRRRHAQR
ncbi:putative Ig domain-containing protein [Curtobacterium sp. 458]|uniref:putative Ig domain-containing protein n=1 Tax=Curtobacterium sp. 458 TaxID=3050069 RepID=UPI0025B4EE74|nr:putative Ig domain-containing protein [Curtobacterium sp. 458]WJX99825.1 putative Ig domain-containing protein [Curtobacterium sp. 458]